MTSYQIDVSGAKGVPNPKRPVNGIDGPPLGPEGNGTNGKSSLGWCTLNAGPGHNGIQGETAPGADNGANGKSAYSVVITCDEFVGDGLRLLNLGGDGANGNDAGNGGSGSDGGNAGKQPGACKSTPINGGIGGNAGNGGTAGSGGDAGNAAAVGLIYGPGFNAVPLSAYSGGGTGGQPGKYGAPGNPGLGGFDSNGVRAESGASASYGGQGSIGNSGKGGAFDAKQDSSKPPFYLRIAVVSDPVV